MSDLSNLIDTLSVSLTSPATQTTGNYHCCWWQKKTPSPSTFITVMKAYATLMSGVSWTRLPLVQLVRGYNVLSSPSVTTLVPEIHVPKKIKSKMLSLMACLYFAGKTYCSSMLTQSMFPNGVWARLCIAPAVTASSRWHFWFFFFVNLEL